MSATNPTRPPEPSLLRSLPPPPTLRKSWARPRATTTREPAIPRARGWSRTSPRWRAASPRRSLPAAWLPWSRMCQLMKSGDHIVASNNLYGGVPRLFNQVMANFGLEFTYVDTTDPRNVERAIRKNTRYVYIETPTNPLMGLTDIAAVSADRAQARLRSRGGQHLHVAVLPAAHQVWRRHGDALDHEVPQRPQRRSGRRSGVHHERAGGEAGVHSESRGRDHVAVRVLAGAARHQDAGRPHEAARRERPRHGRLPQPAIAR